MTEPRQRTRTTPIITPEPPPPLVEARTMDDIQPNLRSIMNQVAERMGGNVMQRATAVPGFCQIETGIFTLDMALLGGFPEGLVTMLFGWESSGKTTLAKRVAGRMQAKYPDKSVVFVDLEQTYDNQWGAKHGIDNERLIMVRPPSGENAVDIIDAVLGTEETSLVIMDSIPTLIPMKEAEDAAEDAHVALRSRLMAKLCSKISTKTMDARNKFGFAPTVILINQFRSKIGSRFPTNALPGGNQSKYLCTTMVEMKNKEVTGSNSRGIEIVKHNEHAFTIKKSRVGNSLRQGEFVMIRDPEHELGEGSIDEADVVVAYAKKFGIIGGGGGAFRIEGLDEHTFKNFKEIAQFLEEQPEECLDLKRRIIMVLRQEMGLLPIPSDGYLLGYCEAA